MVADLRMASPAAVELVNPKHRNERKTHMALITSYHVPGLYVEDHSIDVPLDWRGLEPMLLAVGSTMRRGAMPAPIAGAPESIKLFYRVVCAPDRINDDLPLLLFLQGGPGGESPRPLSPTSDGTLACGASVSDSFLMRAFERTNTRTNPLYWTLQEFIYADGDTMPIGWAAAEEKAHRAEFDTLARPLMFTGEAMFPWMFEQMPELKPFKPAMDLLMEDTSWDKIYDPQRLACNEVPLQAAVYFDDMYVDSGLQLDTLSRVGDSHAWVTNEFEHDGLHGSVVFKHLFDEALNRGDLRRIF